MIQRAISVTPYLVNVFKRELEQRSVGVQRRVHGVGGVGDKCLAAFG
jgi:hypothetical protein